MLRHYITIAFRNLLKYKVQTVISIIGLSVGLACFAFCSYQFRVNLDFDKDFRKSLKTNNRYYENTIFIFTLTDAFPSLYNH